MQKMKSSKKFLFGLIIGMCFISLAIPTKAANETLKSIADSTIQVPFPDRNNGERTELLIGESNGWNEAVLMFNLTTEFINFTKAELWFQVMSIGGPITLEFYEMASFWTEDSVTWNNAPPAGNFITNISVSEAIVYKVNITSSVEYKTGPWSVRINSTDSSWVRIACKETPSGELHPQIRYDYQEEGDVLLLILFISILIGSIVSVALISVVLIRRKKRKNSPPGV